MHIGCLLIAYLIGAYPQQSMAMGMGYGGQMGGGYGGQMGGGMPMRRRKQGMEI